MLKPKKQTNRKLIICIYKKKKKNVFVGNEWIIIWNAPQYVISTCMFTQTWLYYDDDLFQGGLSWVVCNVNNTGSFSLAGAAICISTCIGSVQFLGSCSSCITSHPMCYPGLTLILGVFMNRAPDPRTTLALIKSPIIHRCKQDSVNSIYSTV